MTTGLDDLQAQLNKLNRQYTALTKRHSRVCRERDATVIKLSTCREALECLLPGLTIDLRYASADDDVDALRSRIQTVTNALRAIEERA